MPAPPSIIDFHVHINPLHLLKPDVRASFASKQPRFEEIQRYMTEPRALLALMDRDGIDRINLINYVAPDVMGYPPEVNQWAFDYAKEDRNRLNPFGGWHPRYSKDARKEIEHLVYTLEIGGVKIHGPHSLFQPNEYVTGSPGLRLLYETCEREGVPVMFHTGTSVFPGARNKYGDPMAIDDVAVDFPRLKIILAHGGRPLWMETATFLVRRHANVYFDVSSIPPPALKEYFPKLDQLMDKAVFGSDWPGPHVPGMRQNADAVAAVVPKDAHEALFRANARKLLGRH